MGCSPEEKMGCSLCEHSRALCEALLARVDLAGALASLERHAAAIDLRGALRSMQRRLASCEANVIRQACGVTLAVTAYAVLTRRRRRLTATGSSWADDTPVEPAFHKIMRRPPRCHSRSSEGGPGRVAQIVLTGGPLGGKATLAARLRTELSERGWRVIIAPSVLALLCNSGCTIPQPDDAPALLQFEARVVTVGNRPA